MPPRVRPMGNCTDCARHLRIEARGLCGGCYGRVRRLERIASDPEYLNRRKAYEKEKSRRYYEANKEQVKARMKRNYDLGISGRHKRPPKYTPKVQPVVLEEVCQVCSGRWKDHGLCLLKLEHEQRRQSHL